MRVKLKDAFDLQMGKTPARNNAAFWNGSHKWISIADLGSAGKFIDNTKENISDEGVKASGIKIVPKGTVVMSFKLSIGKTAITAEDMYTNEAIMAFQSKGAYEIEPDYLYHFCCGTNWSNGTNKAVMGLTLNKATISEYEMEILDISEQLEIAKRLDKLDELISKRRQQLASLDLLVKARFVEMFGDPVSNPKSYPVCQLSKYIEFLTSGSRGWAQYCTDNGTEWFITIKNVKDCHILVDNMQPIDAPDNAEAKRTKVQEGDLLISITADLGRTGVVTKEIAEHGAYINQHLTCIRLNTEVVNPLYVAHFMESSAGKEQFKSKNQSAVKAGLNFNSINSLRITVPPMKIQNEFVNFVTRVDKAKLAAQKSLQELETLKKSLMQQYFG